MSPENRITRLETWRDGFVPQYEEEKKTRADTTTDHETRLRRIEKALYIGFGALGALEIFLKLTH